MFAKKFFLIKNNLFFVANAELNYKAGELEIQLIDSNGVSLPLSYDLRVLELMVMPSIVYNLNNKILAEFGLGLISLSNNQSKADSGFNPSFDSAENETQFNLNPVFIKLGIGVKL